MTSPVRSDGELLADLREFLAEVHATQSVPAPDPAGPVWPLDVGAELTQIQRDVLEFERWWFRRAGAKEQAIRDLFGVSAVRYYQLVNRLIDSPTAAAFDGPLVARLRRVREAVTRLRVRG